MAKPIVFFQITASLPPPLIENQPSIHKLPLTVIIKILCALNPEELIKSCRRVCRLRHQISDQVPCKFMMPKAYWEPNKNINPQTMNSVEHQLGWARVKKYRKVFAGQPKQTPPVPFEVPKILSTAKDNGEFDSFGTSRPPFFILTNGNYPLTYDGIRKISIMVFKYNYSKKDLDRVNTIDHLHYQKQFLRDVQPVFCEDLLMMRLTWADTRNGEVLGETIQGLIVQYTTGDIIADSEKPNVFPFPKKLLEAFRQYPFPIDLKKTKTEWTVSLATPSEMVSLQYDLDLKP